MKAAGAFMGLPRELRTRHNMRADIPRTGTEQLCKRQFQDRAAIRGPPQTRGCCWLIPVWVRPRGIRTNGNQPRIVRSRLGRWLWRSGCHIALSPSACTPTKGISRSINGTAGGHSAAPNKRRQLRGYVLTAAPFNSLGASAFPAHSHRGP
jgi:hypothetical protein